MNNWIKFVFCSYGLTSILLYGQIFEKIRPKNKLFSCSLCMGWWVGLLLYNLSFYTQLFTFDKSYVTAFLLACSSSGSVYILDKLIGDDGLNVNRIV